MLSRAFRDLIHVDEITVRVHATADDLKPAAGHVDGRSMGEIPTGLEVQPEVRVAGVEQREGKP